MIRYINLLFLSFLMQYLVYLSIIIICFLGLLAGITLGAVVREEIVSGRRWLLLLKKIMYLLLAGAVLYFHHTLFVIAFVFVAGGVGYFFMNHRIVYLFLGFLLGMLYASPAFLPAAVLIFLFGLPAGSLMASTRKGARLWRMMQSTVQEVSIVFFLPALPLPLLLPFLFLYL